GIQHSCPPTAVERPRWIGADAKNGHEEDELADTQPGGPVRSPPFAHARHRRGGLFHGFAPPNCSWCEARVRYEAGRRRPSISVCAGGGDWTPWHCQRRSSIFW